jgi:anti-sigma-K factor RskA
MRYEGRTLRETLAGEYVLGTLRGAARRRFEALAAARPTWRREIAFWEERLGPLAESLRPVEPPARVWSAIEARIHGRTGRTLRWWQTLAGVSSALAIALVAWIGLRQEPLPAPAQVVVLVDQSARPGWVAQLDRDADGRGLLRVAVQPALAPQAGRAFELWMLPAGGAAPVSLGLLPQRDAGRIELTPARLALLLESGALAVSLEPEGGSPTGQPTGPVLYQGRLTVL